MNFVRKMENHFLSIFMSLISIFFLIRFRQRLFRKYSNVENKSQSRWRIYYVVTRYVRYVFSHFNNLISSLTLSYNLCGNNYWSYQDIRFRFASIIPTMFSKWKKSQLLGNKAPSHDINKHFLGYISSKWNGKEPPQRCIIITHWVLLVDLMITEKYQVWHKWMNNLLKDTT